MKVDPRFSLAVDHLDGQVRLRISAAAPCDIGEDDGLLLESDFDELGKLASAPQAWREASRMERGPTFLSNGWQSWSFAGELRPQELVRASSIRRFSLFSQGPAGRSRRAVLLSYFYIGLRVGEGRLYLVSRNSGGAPLAFKAERRGRGLSVEALAAGASYAAGEAVAELRLFYREDYFAAKRAFRDVFKGFGHFDRLAFLGYGGTLVPGGYESWYNHYTDISEALIAKDLEGLGEPGNLISDYYVSRGKPTVFQVDDGWELRVGDWFADLGKFPSGLASLSSRIEDKGYIPGLWVAPFLVTRRCAVFRDHPEWILRDERGRRVLAGWNPNWDGDFWALDLSVPEVEEYLVSVFERAVEDWGYRYLKLDFLYAAFLPGRRSGGGAAFQHYERIIGRITSRIADGKGRPVAWLGCGAPLESSYRHFPLMRIGADTREAWEYRVLKLVTHEGRPSAFANLLATIGRSILDGTVFVNDPDVVFCREKNNRLSETEKELVAVADFLLASQIMFSDGAEEVRTEAVRAFTARIIALYDRLAGREYGAELLAPNVYKVMSADGHLRGVMNLSDRPHEAGQAEYTGTAIVEHARRRSERVIFEAHSVSLYEV